MGETVALTVDCSVRMASVTRSLGCVPSNSVAGAGAAPSVTWVSRDLLMKCSLFTLCVSLSLSFSQSFALCKGFMILVHTLSFSHIHLFHDL